MTAHPQRPGRTRILEQIREAALQEFSLHGFKGASTQAIASRAGVSKQQLHYYIASKEQLYEELLQELLQAWANAFTFDPASERPREVLITYIRKKLDFALDQPALSRLFTSELLSGGTNLGNYWPLAVEVTQRKVDVVRAWIAKGLIRPVNPQLLLMHIWAMTQHYADYDTQVRALIGSPGDAPLTRDAIATEITNTVLLGCSLPPL